MPSQNELDEIYKVSGELVLDFGVVETYWYLLFTVFLSELDRAVIDSIYNFLETSSNKRKLLLSIADAKFTPLPATPDRPHNTRKILGQLYARTEELAGIRNAVAHAEISPAINILTFSPGTKLDKPNKLSGKDTVAEIRAAITQVEKLCYDLGDFLNSMIPVERRYMSKDLIAALQKSGFQVPSWAIPRQTQKEDEQQTSQPRSPSQE